MTERGSFWREAKVTLPHIFMMCMIALDEANYLQVMQSSMSIAEKNAGVLAGDIGNALVLAAVFALAFLKKKDVSSPQTQPLTAESQPPQPSLRRPNNVYL